MGRYRIIIDGVGDHGQDRTKGDGETVDFSANNPNSPEAIILRAIEELKARGGTLTEATVHHWPGQAVEVLDNLLTGKRVGHF